MVELSSCRCCLQFVGEEIPALLESNGEWTVVSTLAGRVSGTYADGSGTNAGFRCPAGVAVDASGNVFVGDEHNQRIRKVTAGSGMRIGPVTLLARACFVGMDFETSA
jgi:hypothetical protein